MRLLVLFLLACLITPVRAAWGPLVYASVSEAQLTPGMLFELRIVTEGTAAGITLDLPPGIVQVEKATIGVGVIYIPLAVRENAPPGAYTIRATVRIGITDILVSTAIHVGDAPPVVWRYALPAVVR